MAELDAKEMKEQLATALDGVEGWLHPLEAWQLHEAARLGRGSDPRPLVVEIGAWGATRLLLPTSPADRR